jgi:hypothetical protein
MTVGLLGVHLTFTHSNAIYKNLITARNAGIPVAFFGTPKQRRLFEISEMELIILENIPGMTKTYSSVVTFFPRLSILKKYMNILVYGKKIVLSLAEGPHDWFPHNKFQFEVRCPHLAVELGVFGYTVEIILPNYVADESVISHPETPIAKLPALSSTIIEATKKMDHSFSCSVARVCWGFLFLVVGSAAIHYGYYQY